MRTLSARDGRGHPAGASTPDTAPETARDTASDTASDTAQAGGAPDAAPPPSRHAAADAASRTAPGAPSESAESRSPTTGKLRAVRWRRPAVSVVVRPRSLTVGALLALGVLAALVVSVSVGEYSIGFLGAAGALFGIGETDGAYVVTQLRFPRALTGILVGTALGLSGAIFQSVARNPLASPDVLGVTTGAGAAAVAGITLGVGGSTLSITGMALAGGVVAAVLVYVLAWRRGASTGRLIVIGIGVGFAFYSISRLLLVRADLLEAQRALVWLTGSLHGRSWEHAAPVAAAVVILTPLVLALARTLLVHQLGDELARGLGLRLQTSRGVLVAAAVVLAAVATAVAGPIGAVAGPIGFVALISPQIARRLCGGPGLPLLPSACTGALLVLVADTVGRRAFAPIELPVGVVMAIIGAPYFLWLVARRGEAS